MMNEILGIKSERPMVLATYGSVGAGGQNDPVDVRLIQSLLNLVPAAAGGPSSPLQVDGLIGPKTIASIRAFQKKNLGFEDGRVDARNKTIYALGENAIKKNSAFAHPRFFPAPGNDVAAILSATNPNSPIFRQYGRTARNLQLVGGASTGFGAPFTPSGWTINNNAFSADISTSKVGVIVYRLEIFQDANPSEKFTLNIASVLLGVPGLSVPNVPGANFSLPTYTSTQGKIIRGLIGIGPLGKFSFMGPCGVLSVGASLATVGGSVTLFQFNMGPPTPPGMCVGFAIMAGQQKGLSLPGVAGGTGMAVAI